MRNHRLRIALVATAVVVTPAACGQPGEVPPPGPADEEEIDPEAPSSPAPDIEPLEPGDQ
jgi:hypothetical protein